MDNLLQIGIKALFDNGVIPIEFGGAATFALLGFMAYSNGKDDKFWKDLGLAMMGMAGIGIFVVAINLIS